jgi:hypothetical protein
MKFQLPTNLVRLEPSVSQSYVVNGVKKAPIQPPHPSEAGPWLDKLQPHNSDKGEGNDHTRGVCRYICTPQNGSKALVK